MFTFKKKLLILCAVVLAVTLMMPGIAIASEYDPTATAEENQQVGTEPEQGSDEGIKEELPSESESSSEISTETTTVTTVTKATTAAPTTATDPVYKGVNATRIPIITYHRITSAAEKKCKNQKKNSLFLTVSVFEQQMKWLKYHGYRTISTEEFYKWYAGKIRLPKKSVLITFDDGSYSVIKYALPILKKYNFKATVFIIGANTKAKTYTGRYSNGSYSCIGRDVMNQVKATYPRMEFQSHTYNMHRKIKRKPALKKTNYAQQKNDFTVMYKNYRFTFLAYPYGKYKNTTISAAKASHVKMAFTYGTNAYATKKQNRYAIKRIKISANQSMKKFYRWFIK